MTASPTLTDRPTGAAGRAGGAALIASALGFVLLYFAVNVVTPILASSSLPLPDDPVSELRTWYADNQLAAVTIAVIQALSVTSLAGFVVALARRATTSAQDDAVTRAQRWGLLAVALMLASCASGCVLAAVAPDASLRSVSALRTANFVAGGTAHVLVLGVFVVLASRIPGFGRAVRVLAVVALVPAILSLSSLVVFEGAAFILLGRLLCMTWVLTAAITAAIRLRRGTWR